MFYWLISGYFVRFLVASALIGVAALAWKAWRARPVLARPA
jgi:hypothetical protein